MFEDRRNHINGRPPVPSNRTTYAKNTQVRRASPSKGWDRGYPLDPLPKPPTDNRRPTRAPVPTGYSQRQQVKQVNGRARGASLERGGRRFDEETMRRTKSQFQVDDIPAVVRNQLSERKVLGVSVTTKPSRSMNSLLIDDNQNDLSQDKVDHQGYDYIVPRRSSHANPSTYRRNSDDVENGNNHGARNVNHQTYRKIDAVNGGGPYPETLAALEQARRLELEKKQIKADAKQREQELLNTIRRQQELLDRLQQAAVIAEQKTQRFVSEEIAVAAPKPKIALKPVLANNQSVTNMKASIPASRPTPPTSSSSSSRSGPTPSASKAPAASKAPPAPRRSIFSTAPTNGDSGLVPCSVCSRSFASDRIEKHEGVCAKTKAKKRKVFDITKMRVQGTEAESFVLPAIKSNNPASKKSSNSQSAASASAQTLAKASRNSAASSSQEEAKKPDWRKKHESFIEAIRAAKKVQKHLNAGGKLSDLPPPPPSDTSDYIQCPHCKRRFSPGAADRHIPKCANIKSNKPK